MKIKFFKHKKKAENKYAEKLFISPRAEMAGAMGYVGLALRALVAFAGIFGLMLFAFDAVGIYNPGADFRVYTLPVYVMVIVSLIFALLATAASINKITKIAVPLGTVTLVLLITFIAFGNPFEFFENVIRRLYNDTVYGISKSGYTSFTAFMVNDSYSFDKAALHTWAAVIVSGALAIIMYFAVVQKARLWLTAVITALILAPVLVMNLTRTNGGFAFTLSFIAAFFALRSYESMYMGRTDKALRKKRERREKREKYRRIKAERRLEKLKITAAADRVFDAAIKAEMGTRRARLACAAVKKKCLAQLNYDVKKKKNALKQQYKSPKKEKPTTAENKREAGEIKLRNRAAGGFAGAAALVIVLLAVWIPAAAVEKPFKVIEPIDNVVSDVRRDVTNYLMGDDINLNSASDYLYGSIENFNYENLSFDAREYKNVQIFMAQSARKLPVYFKSRSAMGYSLVNDSWMYADADFVIKYNEKFGKGFTPDTLTVKAYEYLYPSAVRTPPKEGINLSDYGFYIQKLSMTRINGDSKLFFIPTVFNSTLGVFNIGEDTKSSSRVAAYFDGIFTTHGFGVDEGYGAVGFVHNMGKNDIGNILKEEAEVLFNVTTADKYSIATDLPKRYNSMTDSEKEEYDKFIELSREYGEWVHENYTSKSGSAKIASLAENLIKQSMPKGGDEEITYEEYKESLSVYDKVMIVKEYLGSEEFTYTLAPEAEEYTGSAVEAFLFDVKQGYCSHFATAAALLLREMEVPTRYCEGYIADKWDVAYGTTAVERYRSNVMDSDAHTWIEVYHDGIGWINYEVTKPYLETFYSSSTVKPAEEMTESELLEESREEPVDRPAYDDDTVEITPEDFISEEEAQRLLNMKILKWVIIIGSILVVICSVLAVVLKLIDRRAKKAISHRFSLAADAKNEEKYRDFRIDKRAMAREMIDSLFTIFEATGTGPRKGEQLSQYAERVLREAPGMSTQDYSFVMECILKEEYGHGLSYKEMCALANYYSDVMVTVGMGLTFSQKIKLRYIRCII